MRYTENDIKYLNGDYFSDGYVLDISNNPLYERVEQLLRICKGMSVLHVGCCDHIPLIDTKVQNNEWLQGLLEENCKQVIGIDINIEAIEYITNKNYSSNIYYANILTDSIEKVIPNRVKFDYVLLGEILEHTDNPVEFLEKMRKNLDDYGFNGKYIITVPNALSLENSDFRKPFEKINSDHRYWFTPFTLAKVMMRAGIKPTECLFAGSRRASNGRNIVTRKVFKELLKIRNIPSSYNSYRGECIIVIGE